MTIYIGKQMAFASTMMAILANGDTIPNCFTIVDLSFNGGDTLAQVDLPCTLIST